MFERYLSTDLV